LDGVEQADPTMLKRTMDRAAKGVCADSMTVLEARTIALMGAMEHRLRPVLRK
jgi:hypothetical protein